MPEFEEMPEPTGEGGGRVLRPEAWHRQPTESAQAYRTFELYLSLGEDRSLPAVAQQRGCHLSLLKRWSARHRWRDRARAWEERHRRQVVTETRAQEAAYGRRLRQAEQLEKVAMVGLRSLLVRDRESGELRFDRRLKPTEIASLIRVACQMLPTPPAAAEEEPAESGLEHLSEPELRRLEALLNPQPTEENADDSADR